MTRPLSKSTPAESNGEPSAVTPADPTIPETDPADPTTPAALAGSDADLYDLESLRLDQDFASALGVQEVLTTVPVKKPEKTWWVRTHPDEGYRFATGVLELPNEGLFLVARKLWPAMAEEPAFKPHVLVLAVNRQNVPFLWPLRLPDDEGGGGADWHKSAIAAAGNATTAWTRVVYVKGFTGYRVQTSQVKAEPVWPGLTMDELIKIAFKDRMIDKLEHPSLDRLWCKA
jgi:hypothetical protein